MRADALSTVFLLLTLFKGPRGLAQVFQASIVLAAQEGQSTAVEAISGMFFFVQRRVYLTKLKARTILGTHFFLGIGTHQTAHPRLRVVGAFTHLRYF